MIFVLCELAAYLCLALSFQKSGHTAIIRHPFGFQMCDRFCSTFNGYQALTYDSVQLRCTVEIIIVKSRSCDDVQPDRKTCITMARYSQTIHAKKGFRKVLQSREVSWYKNAKTKGASCEDDLDTDDQNMTLHQACRKGKLCVVKFILDQHPADINSRDKNGRTPVMVAAAKGQAAVYDFLIGNDCDLSLTDNNNVSLLHLACTGDSTHIVRDLIENQNFNKDLKGWEDWTPMMVAATYGSANVFDLLVGMGCNVTVVDKSKNNMLHVACMGGYVDMVEHILSKGIYDIESKGSYGRTPVLLAAESGHIKVVQLLVSHGCKQSAVDDRSYNILHLACLGGHINMVEYIVSKRITDIESKGEYGRTPVIMAAYHGRREVMRVLIRYGCNQSAVDDNNDTILHVACAAGRIAVVKYILSKRILGIDARGQAGKTPLLVAAVWGKMKIIKYLIHKGCNIKIGDFKGNNILHVACSHCHFDLVKYILSLNKIAIDSWDRNGRAPVLVAAIHGNMEIIKYLVQKECNFTLPDSRGNNILHLACLQGHITVVKYILVILKINIECRGQFKLTPVMDAAVKGKKKVFDFLVSQGSKLSVKDKYNNNILHMACMGGNTEIVKYLLSHRSMKKMIQMKNKFGETPLMTAERRRHSGVVVLFKGGMYVK